MKILIRQAQNASPAAPLNGQVQDILIEGETIVQIAPHIDSPANQPLEAPGLIVSPGWVDPFLISATPVSNTAKISLPALLPLRLVDIPAYWFYPIPNPWQILNRR